MPEVGGENPGAQTPRSDVIKSKEPQNGQDIVVQSFLRASALLSEFPTEKLTSQQLAAKDLMAWATRKTIDSKKRTFKNKFDSTDRLKVYVQEEGIPVDELISFLQERVQSGDLDRKDTQTYKKLGRTLLQNSTSYYDAHRMGTRETLARVQREAARIREDKRLRTGSAKGDFLKAQSLLLQRRELIIPPKDVQPETTIDPATESVPISRIEELSVGTKFKTAKGNEGIITEIKTLDDGSTVAIIDITDGPLKGTKQAELNQEDLANGGFTFLPAPEKPDKTQGAGATSAEPDAKNAEAWTPSLFDAPIEATWKNKDTDTPIKITGYMGKGPDGRDYFSIEGGTTGIPLDEIDASPDVLDTLRTKIPATEPAEKSEKADTASPTNLDENSKLPPFQKTETNPSASSNTNHTESAAAEGKATEEYGETTEATSPTEYSEYADTAPLEDIRRDFYIINRSIDVRKRAAELAEEAVRNEQRRGSGFNPLNWARKVRMRIFEEFYRQRYIDRASRAMIENNNTFLGMDVVNNAAIEANRKIDDERAAGQSKIEGLRTGERIVGEDVRQAEGELKTALMNELIRPIVSNEITNYEQVQERLRAFVEAHREDPQIQELFGTDANQWGRQADYFATDLLEMGNLVKADISANKYALDQLDNHINIQLANTDWAAETQARFTTADRAIAAMQRSRIGGLLGNPAFVGAVTSIGVYGVMRLAGYGAQAGLAVPGAGMLTGAAFAGIRRNYDLKVDRASDQITQAYNMRAEGRAPRRERLNDFNYEAASVNTLLNGNVERGTVGGDTRGLRELMGLQLSGDAENVPQNREALLRRITEIRTRLDFSARESVDLITFESRETVEQGRLELIRGIVEARMALQNAGMTNEQIGEAQTRFAGEWDARFTQNTDQQDRAFRTYRLRRAALAGVFGAFAGLTSGLLVKEGISLAQGNGIDWQPFNLAREGLGKIEDFKDLFQKGGSTQVGNYNISASADHALSIVDTKTGESISANGWSVSENGHITAENASPDVIKQFQDAGFDTKDGGETTRTIFDAAGATEHQSIPGTDGAQHETLVPQGTKWVRDIESGKYDLVDVNNQNTKLVNDAAFGADGKLTYDQSTSLIKEMQLEGGTKQVFGPDGEWAKHAKTIDHREWYSYDQPNSQGNELGFDTYKNGDSVTLDMTRMGLGYQNGLNPNPIDVQQAIANHEVGFAISNPADPQNPIWVSDGTDGVWDGKVTLSATNANADIYKMVINQDALSKLSDGNIATELNGRQDVFSIGSEGKMGTIEAGRLVPGQNGSVLQTFATIRGSTPTPTIIGDAPIPEFTVPSPITEAVHVTELIPPSEREIPIIPIPFAPRHPLEAVVAAPVTGVRYHEYSEYAEEEPTEYNEYGELISKGEINHTPYTSFASEEERSLAEKERTSEALIQERLSDQQQYLDTLQSKYTLTSPDPDVQKMLFRLNGSTKSYIDELTELNKSLPPMPEEARLTVIIPAYNEEGKIERTLQSWANQKDTDGNPIDPKSLDILILVNRPNQTKEFDNTSAVISNLKNNPAYTNLTINVVHKTFNFQDQDASITGPTGEQITVPRGVMMGLVYKVGADLAILRNQARQDALRKANHLMRTGGADAYSRNPNFTTRALDWFSSDPDLEQYVSRSDYPPKIYQKLPLLHVAQRLNEMMNVQFTNKGSNIGLGTYRMGIYASSGGFNTKMAVREEIDLSSRIRKAIRSKEAAGRKRETVINALDDPRRAIAATLKGIPITQIYSNWGNDDVRKVDIEKVLQEEVPSAAALTTENVQKQVDAVLKFYFRQILSSPAPTGLTSEQRAERAYKLTEQYMKRSLAVLGIDHYEIGHGTTISPDGLFVKVKDIDKLKGLIEQYPGRERPAWIDENVEAQLPQTETIEHTTPTTDAEALQNARAELGTITTPTEAVIPTRADVLSPSDKWTVEAIEQGGTPILNALKIENILDGQECITPSGHKGKVIDHITLPDGSPALRIEITEGNLKGIWGTFDQEDLNNGKIATWTTNATGPSTTTSAQESLSH